jgi:hypothetical protein
MLWKVINTVNFKWVADTADLLQKVQTINSH